MSWEQIETIPPSGEWIGLTTPIQSRLLRLTYTGDTAWLDKFQPRAYLRLRVADVGYSQHWYTLWPKVGPRELLLIEPIPIADNFIELRKRRNPYGLGANYTVTIEEYRAAPYIRLADPALNYLIESELSPL